MDQMHLPMAKILVHSEGLGAPDPETVRRRAEELALINGHRAYTEGDWQQARVELHGAHLPNGELTDEMASTSMVSESDMLVTDTGHHRGRVQMEDERNVVEELWQEGMEEAEHERMYQACEAMRDEDEADEEE